MELEIAKDPVVDDVRQPEVNYSCSLVTSFSSVSGINTSIYSLIQLSR